MARPKKKGVDYFQHDVNASSSKTLFILQSRFGNDGYAFWFKLLEILGRQEDLSFRSENPAEWEFFVTVMGVSGDKANEILDLLANISAIDKELWTKSKIIWSQNFVDRLSVVYDKRSNGLPSKPLSESKQEFSPRKHKLPTQKPTKTGVLGAGSTHSIGEDSIGDNIEEAKASMCTSAVHAEPAKVDYEAIKDYWNEKTGGTMGMLKTLSEARRKSIRARIRETSLEDFLEMIDKASTSSFMHGDNNRGWMANFDWCIKPTNYAKILDGNYNQEPAQPKPQARLKGVGEYRNSQGQRTYGNGKYIIPEEAPPRPSSEHGWYPYENRWGIVP